MATSSLDPRAISLILAENFAPSPKRNLADRRLKKKAKQGKLDKNFFSRPGREQQEWAYRIFAANMMLGKNDWWGWECRSEWAWALANNEWHYPRWSGKKGKLIVLAEQGIGDEILFISAASDMWFDNPETYWEADSRLLPILRRSIPEINWVSRWYQFPIGSSLTMDFYRGEYDCFIPSGNVPKLYREHGRYPRKPYLIPNPERVSFWKGQYEGRRGFLFKAGALGEKLVAPRDIGAPGDVNLQHDVKIPWAENPVWEDMDDYIALIAALDGVTAVPSAVVHICGAIGQVCDVVRPPKKIVNDQRNTLLKWYYPNKRKMDWYGDHVTLYQNLNDYKNNRIVPRAKSGAA